MWRSSVSPNESPLMFGDAGFRPGSRATLVLVKVPKTIDAQSGQSQEGGRQTEDGPTRFAQTRPRKKKSVHPKSQPAGVGYN